MKVFLSRFRATDQCPPRKPFTKIVWSWLGAFLGIYSIGLLSYFTIDSLLVIGSFGATAILIYGAPKAEFSQPRNLVGGHVVSALIGVTCYKLLGDNMALASASAVSLALVGMHMTRTLHPPGGAASLIAVIGSQEIHDLGYYYVLCPVLVGSIVMLLIALLVNNISRNPKRHYPVYWY